MASGRLFGSDMAARLRRKFVLVAEVSVAVVLAVIVGGVDVANYISIRVNADELIELIAEYDGTFPTVVVSDAGVELDGFDVLTDLSDGDTAGEDADAAADGGVDADGADADGAADTGGESVGTDESDEAAAEAETGTKTEAEVETDTETEAGTDADAASDTETSAESTVESVVISPDEAFELFEETHGRISAESTYETRYFTVTLDGTGAAVSVDTSNIAALTSAEAAALAEELAQAGRTEGFYGNYRYREVSYTGTAADDVDNAAADDTDGTAADGSEQAQVQSMYIFVDCTSELESFDTLLKVSLGMSAIGLLLVFALVVIFSRFVVLPIAESYEKQKRFITDASHEIKTPLSVIDAADEVVEIEYGESEWTQSIHDQVARLADLTNRLVFLSRMDEGADGFAMEEFSLSQVVEQAAEPYAAVARARGKELVCEVEPGLTCKGDSKALSQVVELLLDNALQYSSEGSEVRLVARRHGRRCQIVVQNECDQLPEGDLDRLFERFYRADSSRSSETGGSGVGLSVVRAIAEAHKGTARAERVGEHAIRFIVEL